MTAVSTRLSRREQILQALAQMLEKHPGTPITTSRLAQAVGVSEAALYRHFPSKAKMFEGLIQFMEETLFSCIQRILKEESGVKPRCAAITQLLLTFAQRNPGMCRILMGDALSGEVERLRHRVSQLFERLETQLKQIIREAELREGIKARTSASISANLILASAEGRIHQFVRSDFKRPPTQDWDSQWLLLVDSLF